MNGLPRPRSRRFHSQQRSQSLLLLPAHHQQTFQLHNYQSPLHQQPFQFQHHHRQQQPPPNPEPPAPLDLPKPRQPLIRKRLDPLSRNLDILFLVFQKLKDDQPQTTSLQSSHEFNIVHRPHSTSTSLTVTTTTTGRIHDLVQDTFFQLCRVNRAWARVGLKFLWEKPRIRTCRQLDRFVYTLEHHGKYYLNHIHELVVRQSSIPDSNTENLWWGHARCRAILTKVAMRSSRLKSLDCNWAGSPFDKNLIQSLHSTSFCSLKALRLEPVQMPSLEKCLAEEDLNALISACPLLETLELEEGYEVTNRSVIHILLTCENLQHFIFPNSCLNGLSDALMMGFGGNLKSIKIYSVPEVLLTEEDDNHYDHDHPLTFRKDTLPNIEMIDFNLSSSCEDFIQALFTKPIMPKLTSLCMVHPSDKVLEILSDRLAPQLTLLDTKLRANTGPTILTRFSNRLTSLESLDCCPGSVLGFLGRNITTLSANSSLALLDGLAEQCPNLEDLTLWGGSISKKPQFRTGADPQSGLIYVLEMCPLKRLRLVNAYLGLGPRFWAACAEFGQRLTVLDIELLDCKGMNTWGMFEALRKCKGLRWLRLTELLGVQKEPMLASLAELQNLYALYLTIPRTGTGYFTVTTEDIAHFLAKFPNLAEVGLMLPRPWPDSVTTTPRTSIATEPIEDQMSRLMRGLPPLPTTILRPVPTTVFKNAHNQKIHGKVEWSTPLGYNL